MTEKKESNYDITCRRMRAEFLKYDQEQMIRNFDLKYDEKFLYLPFCGFSYRVDRENGLIEHAKEPFELGEETYNVSMSFYDALCRSNSGSLCGRYTSLNNLNNVVYSSGLGDSFFDEKKKRFENRSDELKRACGLIGGEPIRQGDAGFKLATFSFLPVIFIFYDSDDEFPSSLKLLWDERTLDFVHYETTYYIATVLLDHLVLLMDAKS